MTTSDSAPAPRRSRVFGALPDPDQVRAAVTEMRAATPYETHAGLPSRKADDARTDPIAVAEATNTGRLPDLAAIRIGRMTSSPFTFLRGSAALMAADLSSTAATGLTAQICGDAHASNFGLYASPERRLVFDLNDFDETVRGPWEWDLRRLTTSLVVAGREAGIGEDDLATAAGDASRAYRAAVGEQAGLPVLDGWYQINDQQSLSHFDLEDLEETFDRVVKKARKNTSKKVVAKFAQRLETNGWQFTEEPPVLTQVRGADEDRVIAALDDYADTLAPELRYLLSRYTVVDVAFRIVGLGSVGTRSYVVLLHGHAVGDHSDMLVLQVKEARRSALADWTGDAAYAHDGERIVRGQLWMQTASDILLGWTTIDARPFLVRQFRDMKGSIDPTALKPGRFDDYARLCGAVLGRAHCLSVDPVILHGYLAGPDADSFDTAVSRFAVSYADRTAADHEALCAAVRNGRIAATTGI